MQAQPALIAEKARKTEMKAAVGAHGSPGEVSKIQEAFAATNHQGMKEHARCA